MKKLIATLGLLAIAVLVINCKKHSDSPAKRDTATCTTCPVAPIVHALDADSTYYYVPTAFTPNADGINDFFFVRYNKIDTDSSSVTIWDTTGRLVYYRHLGNIEEGWDGYDTAGVKCPAGHYPVYVQIKTAAGVKSSNCACVTLLQYGSSSCINTGGVTYYFPDQVNIDSGFTYTTMETLCP
jgi:gliding motility-associated-like protein